MPKCPICNSDMSISHVGLVCTTPGCSRKPEEVLGCCDGMPTYTKEINKKLKELE